MQHLYPLPPRWSSISLAQLKRSAGSERAVAHAQRYAESPKGWYSVQGPNGNDKTLILIGIYNAIVARGHTALFVTAQTIVDLYFRALSPDDDLSLVKIKRDLSAVELLVIDELDKADWNNRFVYLQFFEMINIRYNEQRWTAFAFNQDERIPQDLYSRLIDGRWGDGEGGGILRNTAGDSRPHLESLWTGARGQ